jgi:hypothetical protein
MSFTAMPLRAAACRNTFSSSRVSRTIPVWVKISGFRVEQTQTSKFHIHPFTMQGGPALGLADGNDQTSPLSMGLGVK